MVVWFTTSRALWHFNDDGRECSRLDSTYQRHITFSCTGCYQLHPHHRLKHYYPRFIADINLPTSKGWIAWLAKAECTHITFAQDYYKIESKDTGRKWTQVYRVQDQLSANEPTAPYIIGRELNLRKLRGRRWESNPQPSEQLRPKTIKTSASTETATTAYCMYEMSLETNGNKWLDLEVSSLAHVCIQVDKKS